MENGILNRLANRINAAHFERSRPGRMAQLEKMSIMEVTKCNTVLKHHVAIKISFNRSLVLDGPGEIEKKLNT